MRRSILTLAAVGTLVLAACSDDDGDAGTAPDDVESTMAPTPAPVDDEDDAATDGTDDADDVTASTTDAEDVGDTGDTDAGGDQSGFCAATERYAGIIEGELFDADDPTPEDLESATAQLREQLDVLDGTLPDAVDDEFGLIIDWTRAFLDELEGAGYDPAVMTTTDRFGELTEEAASDEYQDATATVASYVLDECGIDLAGDSGAAGTSVPATDG